jgi:hypothetical protein
MIDRDHSLRLLPLGVGIIGGLFLLINRLLTPELTPSQSRSDVVGVILCGVILLIGLLWQRIQPRSPDAVTLEGREGFELSVALPGELRTELAWASHLLLTNTVTRSVAVYGDGRTWLRRGVLGPETTVVPGPIVQRVLETKKPVYLVDLKVYPGRVEFNYLPPNSQGVICQPIGQRAVLILAANAPRSYTRQDEAWIAGLAEKLAVTWDETLPSPEAPPPQNPS